jgi:hypothetical protein
MKLYSSLAVEKRNRFPPRAVEKALGDVRPAHYHLECAVEAAPVDGIGNLDTPPDGRLNTDKRDLELVDRWRCLLRRHCSRRNQRCAGRTLIDMSNALKFSPDHPTV